MDNELIELQTRLAFQEDAIDQLNRSLMRQQQQLDRQKLHIELLQQQVQALMAPAAGGTGKNEAPPHY